MLLYNNARIGCVLIMTFCFSNPTPIKDDLLQNISWPKLTKGDFTYLDIDNELTVVHDYPRQYASWISLIDKYYQHPIVSLG